MTTIAYRDGVMAADSFQSNGNYVIGRNTKKLFRLNDGSVAAIAGTLGNCIAYVEWLNGGEKPTDMSDVDILLLTANGLFKHEGGTKFQIEEPFMSYGSGSAAALGALHAGCDAAEAVRIASLVDPFTGGEIRTIKVGADGLARRAGAA